MSGKLNSNGGEVNELRPLGAMHFHVAGVPWGDDMDIHLIAASGGKPGRMEQSSQSGAPKIFESVPAFHPTGAELAVYQGAYASDEIDPVYRMTIQDGALTLKWLKHEADTLQPATKDVFTGKIGTVRFSRDAGQHVSGFIINAGRIANFHFAKRGISGG